MVAEPGVVAVVRHPRLGAVEALIEQAIAERVFPGAVLAVVGPDGLLHLAAYGQLSYGPDAPPAAVDTLYDLASLTKVVGTTTAVMRLVERGLLDLDRPVGADWPAFAVGERARIRLVHLLTHSAGLPPVFPGHFPVYFRGRTPSREEIYEEVARRPLEYPPGTRTVYSDLGFLVLPPAGGSGRAARPLVLAGDLRPPRHGPDRLQSPAGLAGPLRPDRALPLAGAPADRGGP